MNGFFLYIKIYRKQRKSPSVQTNIDENEEFETNTKTGFKLDLSTVLAVSSDENTSYI